MIRIGIIGSNYGRMVLLPAFRTDARCEVTALAGSDQMRTIERARESNILKAYGDWRELVADANIDAVVIATLPSLQAEIAIAALEAGKPVFAEKPMAGDLAGAQAMLNAANKTGLPTGIDFNFTRIMAWQRAKEMLDAGSIGALRHVTVHWHVESRAIQMRMRNWKTAGGNDGGGVLGNFISHCFHYLEWFIGPIGGLQARVSGLPDDQELQATVAMALQYESGPQISLSMSCASYAGIGHRIEFFGEDGTLVLHNPTADYMRGFDLTLAKRPGASERIAVEDLFDAQFPDGRIAPVSRLANKFLDAIETGTQTAPDFNDGYRVQRLIDAAQRSNRDGQWINFAGNGAEGK
ncbi:MAG: Gfo/Idh/MocA family oxidoreductase [Pseudolabrys sp.]|nr:Gfo/Idh/MocA family oxidoreductase [Pseudolabrys sp.]